MYCYGCVPAVDIERLYYDIYFEVLSFAVRVFMVCSLFDEDVIAPISSLLKAKYFLKLSLQYRLRVKY